MIEAHFEPEPAPQAVSYTFNYLGQMASMTVGTTTTFYVYDEQGRTLSEINEAGESIKDYVYADEELVAWVEKSGDTGDSENEEQVFYPFTNHLGQTFMTMRADVKLGHEQYTDPFGRVQAMYIDKTLGVDNVGPLPLTDGLPGQRLQPSGYYDNWYRPYDATRPGYLQADRLDVLSRAYDPELWMAEEMGAIQLPQYMQMNHLYGYASQNPVMLFDKTGLYVPEAGAPAASNTVKVAKTFRNFAVSTALNTAIGARVFGIGALFESGGLVCSDIDCDGDGYPDGPKWLYPPPEPDVCPVGEYPPPLSDLPPPQSPFCYGWTDENGVHHKICTGSSN